MIVRLSLLLTIIAIACLLSANIIDEIAPTAIVEGFFLFGAMLLLSAFSLIFLTGLSFVTALSIAKIAAYFSPVQRLQRKLLFHINKINSVEHIFQLKKNRLRYFAKLQRKRLLQKSEGF